MSNIVKTKEQIENIITNWDLYKNNGNITEDKLQLRVGTNVFDDEVRNQIRLKNKEFEGDETISTDVDIKHQYAQNKIRNAIDVLGIDYCQLQKAIKQDKNFPIEKIDEFFSNYKTTIYKYM